MSDLKLAYIYVRSRLLITALTVLSIALGLGLAVIVLLMSHQTRMLLGTEAANWDVVVGAKGSPLQLVLNSLYYLDAPTGNISRQVWDRLQADPTVSRVVPVNMGDNYYGSPIVGTAPDFFAGRQAPDGTPLVAAGRLWEKPLEAVVGAEVAARHQLALGQQIVGAHGWARSEDWHPHAPYTIVGLLARTGTSLDRAVYCDYHTVWLVHAHHHHEEEATGEHEPGHAETEGEEHGHGHGEEEEEHGPNPAAEVTTLLVSLRQPAARFGLVQEINRRERAMATVPVDEVSKLDATFIAPLRGVLLLVAYLVVMVSCLSILISLYLTIHQRRRDLVILRSLGATRGDVFRLITIEAALVSGLGVVVGWLFGHGLTAALAPAVFQRYGIFLQPGQLLPGELAVGVSVWLLGIIAGLLPALTAYRLRVADFLVEE